MKISSKLKAKIREIVYDEGYKARLILDGEDRNNKIPHVSWQKISIACIAAESNISDKIIHAIETYSNKH